MGPLEFLFSLLDHDRANGTAAPRSKPAPATSAAKRLNPEILHTATAVAASVPPPHEAQRAAIPDPYAIYYNGRPHLQPALFETTEASSANAAPIPAPPAETIEAGDPPEPAVTRISIELLVSGAPVGSTPVDVSADGRVARVDVARLLDLLEPIVAPTITALITDRAGGRDFVDVDELRSADFPIAFDFFTLRLQVDISGDARAVQRLSLRRHGLESNHADITPPAPFSFGMTVGISDKYRQNSLTDPVRELATAVARGFVNIGGIDGIYLTFDGGLREEGEAYRRNTTLFYDDVDNAVRWSVGDNDMRAMGGYQQSLDLLGFGVQRLYDVIQPYRTLRPSGRGMLVLDRPSRVEVLVNGQVQRTLDLPAGRYDVREFSFLDGANDVRFVIQDELGRREALSVSFFSDVQMLDPGVSLFSFGLGLPRATFNQYENTNYDEDLAFSGFYQRGITNWLTLGASAQGNETHALATAQIAIATSIGVFGVESATDMSEGEAPEHALLASWKLTLPSEDSRTELILDFERVSDQFRPLESAPSTPNPYAWEADARIQTRLGGNFFLTLGGGYSEGRVEDDSQTRYSANVTQSFERFSVSGGYSYAEIGSDRDERWSLSLSIPLGSRQTARTRYESAANRFTTEWDRRSYDALNETGARVSLARSDNGDDINVDFDHYANRFSASLRHDYRQEADIQDQTTEVSLVSGIGYVNGQFAIGREADRGFVIVDPHRSLEDRALYARNRYAQGEAARSGALGPALVPIEREYGEDAIEARVEDLPPGYDIGSGRINIHPGAASGYYMPVGSAASNTVMGVAHDASGGAIAFAAGELRPLEGGEAEPAQFFTNRTGRFVAQRVAPGRYAIVPNGQTTAVAEIVVPEDSDGIVNVGTIIWPGRS